MTMRRRGEEVAQDTSEGAAEDIFATGFRRGKNELVHVEPPAPLETLNLDDIPEVSPLSRDSPTVCILPTAAQDVQRQTMSCRRMFHAQGFGTQLVHGIEKSVELPHPRTHWAWALAFLPKVCMLCRWHGLAKTQGIILAENSCWPTDSCTPARLREVLEEAVAHGTSGSWIGYCGCDVLGSCQAPRGSKLFVITVGCLELLCKAFQCAPTSSCNIPSACVYHDRVITSSTFCNTSAS